MSSKQSKRASFYRASKRMREQRRIVRMIHASMSRQALRNFPLPRELALDQRRYDPPDIPEMTVDEVLHWLESVRCY